MRATPPALGELLSRGAHAGDVAAKALSASRDAALATAERITRREGADQAADALHSMRSAAGVLEADELPITDYDALNVSQAVPPSRNSPLPPTSRDPGLRGSAQGPSGGCFRRSYRVAAIAQEVVGIG